ncbi:MAG: hypothetical protein U5K51_15050 [Flavobacteriaceae bacterium]|nr:hypothetical protein [Flavobacteriaceae bacterium]
MKALGIDIGGTGIKGAPVDLDTGELLAERFRVDTPRPATPENVTKKIIEIVRSFSMEGCCWLRYSRPHFIRENVKSVPTYTMTGSGFM